MFPMLGPIKVYTIVCVLSMAACFVAADFWCRRLALSRRVGLWLGVSRTTRSQQARAKGRERGTFYFFACDRNPITMDIRSALKNQYQAGLATVRQGIERCPDDLWVDADGRVAVGPSVVPPGLG